jgi:hypothetical protein
VGKVCAGTPQHGMKRFVHDTPFGTYSTTPFCANAPANAENLPSSTLTVLPIIFSSRSGCFSSAVFKVGEDDAFFRELFIEFNFHAPGHKDDLSAVLVRK